MAHITISNPRFVGLAIVEREGTAVVTPAWRTTGMLWWKKTQPGFAVQIVCTIFENCGSHVDSFNAWRNRGFFLSRREATEYRDELLDTGAARLTKDNQND